MVFVLSCLFLANGERLYQSKDALVVTTIVQFQCTECDVSKGFALNNVNARMNMLLMEGPCAPPSESGCDATGTIGSIKCADDNVNECQTCDIAKDRAISIV